MTSLDYVNDMLVIAERDTMDSVQTVSGTHAAFETVWDHIHDLCICPSMDKTQAKMFTKHDGAKESLILLKEEAVWLESSLEYLDLVFKPNRRFSGRTCESHPIKFSGISWNVDT